MLFLHFCPVFSGHPRASGYCSQGERLHSGRDPKFSKGGTGKAEANASIVAPERVVFNIKGNDYRLVVAINHRHQIVFIKWIGTHGDYGKMRAEIGWICRWRRLRSRSRSSGSSAG